MDAKPSNHAATLDPVPTPWRSMILVCGKCSRKLKGGFGKKGKHHLRDVLRHTLKDQGRRRELRVVEVGCLGLCPKRAVTVAGTAQPGAVFAVPEGTDPALLLAALQNK